jgi:hypothetical protein
MLKYDDYSVVTRNFFRCMELRRVQFADYSVVTPKSKLDKELRLNAIFCREVSCVRALRRHLSEQSRISGTLSRRQSESGANRFAHALRVTERGESLLFGCIITRIAIINRVIAKRSKLSPERAECRVVR